MNATSNAKPAFEFQLIYMTRTIGFMGLLLNSLGLIIILNKTLIHPIYNFTWGRTFCNWFVCFLGCGWVQSVDFDVPGLYYQRVYSVYVVGIPSRIALFASSISDVMLILNRYFVITEKRVWLLNISKLTNLIICYAFSACLFLPVYFAVRLEAVNSDEEFAFKLTDFGQSTLFRGFAAGTILLETVIGVFALGFLNLLSAIRFREKMVRKANLLQNRTETKRAEEMYSKMVLILTTICFITRLTDTIAGIFIRFANMSLGIYKVSDETKTRISLCYDISFMFLLAAHAFDNWVYFLMDPNLRRCTRMLFCRKTTQTTIVSCIVSSNYSLIFKLMTIFIIA